MPTRGIPYNHLNIIGIKEVKVYKPKMTGQEVLGEIQDQIKILAEHNPSIVYLGPEEAKAFKDYFNSGSTINPSPQPDGGTYTVRIGLYELQVIEMGNPGILLAAEIVDEDGQKVGEVVK